MRRKRMQKNRADAENEAEEEDANADRFRSFELPKP
jgi:hypothetical protein